MDRLSLLLETMGRYFTARASLKRARAPSTLHLTLRKPSVSTGSQGSFHNATVLQKQVGIDSEGNSFVICAGIRVSINIGSQVADCLAYVHVTGV